MGKTSPHGCWQQPHCSDCRHGLLSAALSQTKFTYITHAARTYSPESPLPSGAYRCTPRARLPPAPCQVQAPPQALLLLLGLRRPECSLGPKVGVPEGQEALVRVLLLLRLCLLAVLMVVVGWCLLLLLLGLQGEPPVHAVALWSRHIQPRLLPLHLWETKMTKRTGWG